MDSRERLELEVQFFASLIDRAREQHAPDWMLELLVEQLEVRRADLGQSVIPQSTAVH